MVFTDEAVLTTAGSVEIAQDPINPYGSSKYMLEKVCQDCDRAWGLKSVFLRYFNGRHRQYRGQPRNSMALGPEPSLVARKAGQWYHPCHTL